MLRGTVVVTQITSKRGARCYLAVAGGINTPAYLGSRSTFPGGKLGGVQARRSLPAADGHAWTPQCSIKPEYAGTRMLVICLCNGDFG